MSKKSYIRAGRLIDGSGSDVRKDMVVVEENGWIVDIVPAASIPSDCQDTMVDMSHCTIIPPLFDCSVNLARSASLNTADDAENSRIDLMAELTRHIHFCHSHGVLGVADCEQENADGGTPEQRRGDDEAVTVRIAGQVYSSSKHRALNSDSGDLDFVKIVHTGDIETVADSPGGTEEKENLHRLVHKAREKGKKTVVVANGEKGVHEALASGCDAIEGGYNMGEENLEAMASMKILWIPSLIRAKTLVELAPASQKTEAAKRLKKQQILLGKARSLNLPVAVGTGCGSPGIIHGEAVIEEIQLFVKSGYSLIESLRAASFTGADFFNVPQIGLLQAGTMANFLVSRGMVQQLPRKLLYLENIYWRGQPSKGYRKNPVKTVRKAD